MQKVTKKELKILNMKIVKSTIKLCKATTLGRVNHHFPPSYYNFFIKINSFHQMQTLNTINQKMTPRSSYFLSLCSFKNIEISDPFRKGLFNFLLKIM